MALSSLWTPILHWLLISQVQVALTQTQCSVGTDSDTASAVTTQLFVLNTLEPATCSGTVSSFSYCFTSFANGSSQNTFIFALYRKNGDSKYSNISHSQSVQQVVVEKKCNIIELSSPISVEKGDVLGACLTEQTTLLGNDANPNSTVFLLTADSDICDGSMPQSILKSSLTNTKGLVLQLSASVSSSENSGLLAGEIVGIVVGLVVLLVVVLIIIVIYWRCKSTQNSLYASTEPLLPHTGFDNVGYYEVTHSSHHHHHYKMRADSGTYESVDSRQSSEIFNTPIDSGDSEAGGLNMGVDSGSYAEVRTTPRRVRPSLRPRRDTEELEASQRKVYELESSRAHGCSFICSYENVDHYEPMSPGIEEYLVPVEDSSQPAVTITQLLKMNKEEDIYSKVIPFEKPASLEMEIMNQLKSWGIETLARDSINVLADIGMGQFGTVKEGIWKKDDGSSIKVALKSLKQDCSPTDKLKFLQEAAIAAQFRHPNVIQLHGVVVESQPMMLVVEFAAKGDLRNHLISIRPEPNETPPRKLSNSLLAYSQQVALGMHYLSAKGFVHRDLAARNILLSKKDVCKVADFGLSRDLADESYYVSQGKDAIPVKWTAPEAIHYKKYSTASDVWAYGCLLYEIWSLGHKPFESLTNIQALRAVEANKRLSPPPGCPTTIYDIMILCWNPETSQRPSFREITLALARDKEVVLSIPEEDSSSHPLAGVLGATLEAGENMYTQLQNRYNRKI